MFLAAFLLSLSLGCLLAIAQIAWPEQRKR
jgi:hypothetical protein